MHCECTDEQRCAMLLGEDVCSRGTGPDGDDDECNRRKRPRSKTRDSASNTDAETADKSTGSRRESKEGERTVLLLLPTPERAAPPFRDKSPATVSFSARYFFPDCLNADFWRLYLSARGPHGGHRVSSLFANYTFLLDFAVTI